MQSPIPSCQISLISPDRRPRKAYAGPSNGFSARLCCTSIANPTAPFLMSVTPRPCKPGHQVTARSSIVQRTENAAKARPSTSASTRTKTPLGSTISISPSKRDDGGGGVTGPSAILHAVVAAAREPARPAQNRRRSGDDADLASQDLMAPRVSRPLLIAYLRATSVGVTSEPRLSATIARFCSGVQVRRRSRVRISTRPRPYPVRPIVRTSSTSASAPSGDSASMAAFDHNQPAHRNASPPHRLHSSMPADPMSLRLEPGAHCPPARHLRLS